MKINRNVSVIDASKFIFSPSTTEMRKGDLAIMPDGITQGIYIHTTTVEWLDDGFGGNTTRERTILLPKSVIDEIMPGYDADGNPIVNEDKLNTLMAEFGLQTT